MTSSDIAVIVGAAIQAASTIGINTSKNVESIIHDAKKIAQEMIWWAEDVANEINAPK